MTTDPRPAEPPASLRERKRERTRAALIAAGVELFERDGYDQTTVAGIAAAADIGTRTFFGYFASKEELLFPRADDRVAAALAAIRERRPGERPVDVLLGGLRGLPPDDDELVGRLALLRLRLIPTVPAVAGRAYAAQFAAQRDIAAALVEAYPGELDGPSAAALTGAFVGAIAAALDVLLVAVDVPPPPDAVRGALIEAVESALGASDRQGAGERRTAGG
ncbi:MAG TPA: TetR/AcrR family transcriptional regulator [Candidatus Dormibacteraeota bacterium]|nr:TetR/AcrR family transcriptional regulator [Candidatus Dormibacteraeota bacterium]